MPTLGDVLTQRTRRGSHDYTLTDIAAHTTRAGMPTIVLHWRGACARCGGAFTVTTSRKPGRYLTRTCPVHRRRT